MKEIYIKEIGKIDIEKTSLADCMIEMHLAVEELSAPFFDKRNTKKRAGAIRWRLPANEKRVCNGKGRKEKGIRAIIKLCHR